MMDFTTLDTFSLILGVVAVGLGAFELITKTPVGRKPGDIKPGCEEKLIRYEGLAYLVIGLGGLIMSSVSLWKWLPTPCYYVGWALVIGGLVGDAIVARKFCNPRGGNGMNGRMLK